MKNPNHGVVTRTMDLRTWGLLILLAAIWGGAFFFGQIAVRELPPTTVALGRVGIAAFALLVFVHARGGRMPGGVRLWLMFGVMGLVNNVIPFSLILYGQTQISSGLASILNAMTPIFTVLFAHFLTVDEKLSAGRLVGVACGVIGVALMMGPDVLAGARDNVIGQAVVLMAACSYAMAAIFGRKLRLIPPSVAASGQLTASTLLLLPIVLVFDRPWTLAMPGLETIGAVIGIALICTSLAYVIYFRILAVAGATNVLLVTLLVPVSAILLGTVFLDEVLRANHMLGMAVVGLGLMTIDGRLVKVLRARNDDRTIPSPNPLPEERAMKQAQKNPAE